MIPLLLFILGVHRKTVACCTWSTSVFNRFWVLLLWCVLYLNSCGVTQDMDMPKNSWTNRPTWIFNLTDGISGSVREWLERETRGLLMKTCPWQFLTYVHECWLILLSKLSWISSGLLYFLFKKNDTGSSWHWQATQNQRSIFYCTSPQNVKKSQSQPPSCDTFSCYNSSSAEGF